MEMADGHLFKQIIKKMKSVAGNTSNTLVLMFTPAGLIINVMRKNNIVLYHVMLESRAMANYIYRVYSSYTDGDLVDMLPYKVIKVEFPKLIAAIDTSQKDQGILLRWPFDNGCEGGVQYGRLGVLIKSQVVMTRNSVQIIHNVDSGDSAPVMVNHITIPYRSADIKQKLQNIHKNSCDMIITFSVNEDRIINQEPQLLDKLVCTTSTPFAKSNTDDDSYNETHEAVSCWREYTRLPQDMVLDECSFKIPTDDVKYIKSVIGIADKSSTCFFLVPVGKEDNVLSISGFIKEYGFYQIFIKRC